MNLNDLSLTDEQKLLASMVRSFFAAAAPLEKSLAAAERMGAYDRELWQEMCVELGIGGIALPEAAGGRGASELEESLVLQEMGRALVRSPYLSSIAITAPVLSRLGDEAFRHEVLPRVLDGSLVATCAAFGPQQLEYASEGAGIAVSGEQRLVLDATVCDAYLLFASGADGDGVVAAWVDADAAGIEVRSAPALDQLRPFATVRFHGTTARMLAGPEAGAGVRRVARSRAAYAVGAEQAGVAQHCLDMAAEYAKQRRQFGQAIAAFQVIQHKCADMLVEVESAWSAARFAASLLAVDPVFRNAETEWAAWAAGVVGGRAAVRVAEECIQIHGGIGYTWEHPAHRYLRRAKASQLLLGTPFDQLAALGEMVGLWPAAAGTAG